MYSYNILSYASTGKVSVSDELLENINKNIDKHNLETCNLGIINIQELNSSFSIDVNKITLVEMGWLMKNKPIIGIQMCPHNKSVIFFYPDVYREDTTGDNIDIDMSKIKIKRVKKIHTMDDII